ncbi:MAG: ATP-binding protein [Anaerolineae bacterium]|nr:ATP-binding protein [Anaerolineae bacterium]
MSNAFYLGRVLDEKTGKASAEDLLYDPDDLTTHAVITGMTGSGKTGLGVGLLEEAALHNIPAMILDPKGDLTNLLLHFPELRGADFAPWVDPHTAQQKGITVEELGQQAADSWRKGLQDWGLGQPNIEALRDAASYVIYTPGSTAGVPINIVSSFEAPAMPWEENAEVLRERIASTITALLGLVGMHDIDPLRSREHILLSNIMETAWRNGRSLTMLDLITQIQTPPFDRLGAFPLDSFFPAKERMDLAFVLNNFLASPSFQSWTEGQPLDFAQLMFTADGKPKHNVFYLAHLSEDERMFFVSLFFATFESWMRTQRGTGHLRCLIYFDEVVGYLPPVSNPPSRELILRMLKQARAYGVGLILATQNPVDVDYKALSNAGTWLIGRLQTERDVDRLMDGLRAAGGDAQPAEIRDRISGLPKRCFLIHNIHGGKPTQFFTRWVMNYLAGPMTRSQIPALNLLDGVDEKAQMAQARAPQAPAASEPQAPVSQTPVTAAVAPATASMQAQPGQRPMVPTGIHEIFLPITQSPKEALQESGLAFAPDAKVENGLYYVPHFFQQFTVLYTSSKLGINHQVRQAYIAREAPVSSFIEWQDYACKPVDAGEVMQPERTDARYAPLPDRLLPTGSLSTFKTAMADWMYRTVTLQVMGNPTLKLYAAPDESKEDFTKRCRAAAQQQLEAEASTIEAKYRKDRAALDDKIERAEQRLAEEKIDLSQRQMEELGTGAELLIGLVGGRKRSVSKSLTKRRMTAQAKQDYKEQQLLLRQLQDQLAALEKSKESQIDGLVEKWTKISAQTTVESVSPYKKDIVNEIFGVAWLPCYPVVVGQERRYLPAWEQKKD